MRLNLNRGVQPYVLVSAADGAPLVTIHARPCLTHVMEQAKSDAEILELVNEIKGDMPEGTSAEAELLQSRGQFSVLLAKAIARQVIDSWEGLEDDDGSPAPVTPDRVDALLDLAPIYDAFIAVYMGRWLTLSAEKNDSAPSPIGTSVVAPTTAARARRAAKSAPPS